MIKHRIDTLIGDMTDAAILMSENGIIQAYNHATVILFGYSSHEIVKKNISTVCIREYISFDQYEKKLIVDEHISEQLSVGRHLVLCRHKNGRLFPGDISISRFSEGNDIIILLIIRDLTDYEKIDRVKDEFVSIVSHELRTPLTSINGALGLLLGEKFGELQLQTKQLLEIAYRNSERLITLINDILDLEKIESGKLTLTTETVNLQELINEAVKLNAPSAQQFHIQLAIDLPDHSIKVIADRSRLSQVLSNLLSNAIKFSYPEGKVIIKTEEGINHIRISVIDQGIGIAKEAQRMLFQKFMQLNSSDMRQQGGTGLGLSICKMLIIAMGGSIHVESELNKGATFYIELDSIPKKLSQPSKKLKAIICGNDLPIINKIEELVNQEGFLSSSVYTLEQASEMMIKYHYDVLILDLASVNKEDENFIEQLRLQSKIPSIPVVIISDTEPLNQKSPYREAFPVSYWFNKRVAPEVISKTVLGVLKEIQLKKHVLHIEQDLDVCSVIRLLVHDIAEVTLARTVAIAKTALQNYHYDLVILDPDLPDGSGLELLNELSKIPVIIFSTRDVQVDNPQIKGCFLKSKTSMNELLKVVEYVIEKKENEQKKIDS